MSFSKQVDLTNSNYVITIRTDAVNIAWDIVDTDGKVWKNMAVCITIPQFMAICDVVGQVEFMTLLQQIDTAAGVWSTNLLAPEVKEDYLDIDLIANLP